MHAQCKEGGVVMHKSNLRANSTDGRSRGFVTTHSLRPDVTGLSPLLNFAFMRQKLVESETSVDHYSYLILHKKEHV